MMNAEDALADVLEDFAPSTELREAAAAKIAQEVANVAERLGYRASSQKGAGGETIHTLSYGSVHAGPSVYLAGYDDGVTVWRDLDSREQADLVFMRARKEWVSPSTPDGTHREAVDVVAERVADMLRQPAKAPAGSASIVSSGRERVFPPRRGYWGSDARRRGSGRRPPGSRRSDWSHAVGLVPNGARGTCSPSP